MSSFATLPSAAAGLFDMVDAAEPENELLRKAYRYWQEKRGGNMLPAERAFMTLPAAFDAEAFVFERPEPTSEWTLHRVGETARGLLRPAAEDWRLPALTDRRIAVRLRRLFAMVDATTEPLTASFESDGETGRRFVEVLACPLEGDGRATRALFGVILARDEVSASRFSATG